MNISPTVALYRPDLMMFEQILLQTWRLLCRSQRRREKVCMSYPIFAHVYRGFLVCHWILLYQNKFKLNCVNADQYFKVKRSHLVKIYQDLLVPTPINDAVMAILSPMLFCNRVFYPAPIDIYVDYDEQDYYHGTIIDGSNSKSIDFSASYHRVLKFLDMKSLDHSIVPKEGSYLPGHSNCVFQFLNVYKDENVAKVDPSIVPAYSSVIKPLRNAHAQLKKVFENCYDDMSKLKKFKYVKSLKPTPLVLCNQQGVSLRKWDIMKKCSFLTEHEKRISLTVNSDAVCRVVCNRIDDESDFNPENDEYLASMRDYLRFESGVDQFHAEVIKGMNLFGAKYPFARFIKGKTKKRKTSNKKLYNPYI